MQSFSKTITIPSTAILENIFTKNGVWNPINFSKYTLVQSSEDEILFKKVINLIQTAQQMICLQSFLIQDTAIIDELLKAKERGIKIYIMSAVEARVKQRMYAEVEPDFIEADYIKMLNNKFTGNFIHRSAESLHAKYLVVDGKTNPRGMIFTNNFTKNGFFKNPEIAVELNRAQATALFKLFVFHFWEKTTIEQTGNNVFTAIRPFEQFEFPVTNELLIACDKHNSLKINILKAIQSAKQDICFSTFGFDNDYEIARAIFEKQKTGVKVKIFTRLNDKLLQTQFKKYLNEGATIYGHTNTHAKFLVIDNREAYLLTANFTKIDFESSFNLGVALSAQQTICLNEFVEQWVSQMYQWVDKQRVLNTKKYYKLLDNELKAYEVAELKETSVRFRPETVQKLVEFFEQPRYFEDQHYKNQALTLVAQFETTKNIEITTDDCTIKKQVGFSEMIEFEPIRKASHFPTLRNEKAKWIILSKDFNVISHLADLKQYISHKLAVCEEDSIKNKVEHDLKPLQGLHVREKIDFTPRKRRR